MKNWIFFTGVPGSRWSGVAKTLCEAPIVNNSDRNETRTYNDMHQGNYFGPNMEHGKLFEQLNKLPSSIINAELESPFEEKNDTQLRFLKSHTFAYHLDFIKTQYPTSKIMMVYRDDETALKWWLDAGGFNITYPKYDWYKDEKTMFERIKLENNNILTFCKKHNTELVPFTDVWIKQNFDWDMEVDTYFDDITVAII